MTYAVDDVAGYLDIVESGLPEAPRHIKALQFRHAEIGGGFYINPFNDRIVVQGKRDVAVFDDPRMAALFTVFMTWWPGVHQFIMEELENRVAAELKACGSPD